MEKDLKNRVLRECEAHTSNDVLGKNAKLKTHFPHLENYPSRKRIEDRIAIYIEDLSSKVVLDYGCGRGQDSVIYAKNKAQEVHGIDISSSYIDQAISYSIQNGFKSDTCKFHVMDAHNLDFEDSKFDMVIGRAILHHLDYDVALDEIYRVLKVGGRVLFFEPLADNPLLKLFRFITPGIRTKDEKPIPGAMLKKISKQKRWDCDLLYSGLIEAPVSMLTSIIFSLEDNRLIRISDRIESLFHKRGFLLSWNQYVLLNMVKLS